MFSDRAGLTSSEYRTALINVRIRDFRHQTKYSDGDIYRYIRHHGKDGSRRANLEWRVHLSSCKERILDLLLKRTQIVQALDKLLPLPGLWPGLQMGNIHKHLALHCDEQILHYLGHIDEIWSTITSGDLMLKQHVDWNTVRHLELRAPCTQSDAIYIRTLMDRGQIFPGVKDPSVRSQLLQRILSIQTIIPSIWTFHENMKYFSIAARILRKYVIGEKVILTSIRALS